MIGGGGGGIIRILLYTFPFLGFNKFNACNLRVIAVCMYTHASCGSSENACIMQIVYMQWQH